MPFIIDGHNLIPRVPGLSLDQIDDEDKLIQLLQEFAQKVSKNIDLYFDKAPPGNVRKKKFGRVTAHFVSETSTADAAIKNKLKSMGKAAKNWTLVSADREILAEARSRQVRTINPDEFVRSYLVEQGTVEESPGTSPDVHISGEEINEWLDFFKGE
ncbi:MAG: NYN domain-containing protein [candidate division Zixibacteria bacterium]|nr:NYN domain-containing protein [candidate division Zixibacteria bacterium]NIW43464.1 hypothetical protein [Gammaproteobacteria bacterium]NIR62487.1 NYN domain-containing protein [candidate division Zixibacteria bacterium]NIS44627.1 NYN domain-containing protein [candidate division Zixibacteria bacterium]NIT51707.1 NYN domain-containing protein [candidate division Zixibacteria bacterium]